ncbi:PP2C family protein-serine/threonine phosphatase [Leptospira ilyithenensis]|uniref:Serine/threonine-protein phosphatase n=1 Tax=Leptospira ilyithenensis TaxID=2484901 RepID=A0A4R9LP65_9LEPT|nr:PP2C family protein-serine/threonine phosphatase [Leptospira ilyithenensis]TGN09366.1 serine/threonine-protein phosphatase [Leptospira ilyithenensis]
MLAKIGFLWNRLQKGFAKFVSFVLGPTERFVMRHRILNGTLFAGIFAMAVGLGSEFFREGFETGGLIALWIAFGFAFVFYYLARFLSLFRTLVIPTFIISTMTALLQIKYSGGIVSANIMLFSPILILNMLILGKKFDWMAIVFFVAIVLGVSISQNQSPDWFSDYSSSIARSEDFLITSISVLLLTGLMLRTLNRSYEDAISEIRKLKDQQDADYFLTSLLINPLAGIRVQSNTLKISSYIKQKKTFQIKDKIYELGGDISVADQIILRGRSYSVFANGDAMGKSMQGAGGVLVFGTAFRALIERTHREGILSDYFPERWLRSALNDLNKVFEGFAGSMSMSLILGLVDEENGFMYYINAEHPFPIRLRGGKASFLTEEATNFKLGLLREKARIETTWIRPGDTIIIGSDGRDDWKYGDEISESKIMNEDHRIILQLVEKSEGDLQLLGEILEKTGELTDDLSLLNIRFEPKQSIKEIRDESSLKKSAFLLKNNETEGALAILTESTEKNSLDPALWKLLFRTHKILNHAKEAGQAAEVFSNLHPSGLQMILEGAVQYAKAGRIENAIDMAERIYSRKPDVIPVLKLLVRLYKKSKRFKRSEEYQMELERLLVNS